METQGTHQIIRVGTLVRFKSYPPGLTDLSGEPVVDPEELLNKAWPVCSLGSGIVVSFRGAGFVNRVGHPIVQGGAPVDAFVVVGYEEPRLCEHCQPVLSELLSQSNQQIMSLDEDGWPGSGRNMFLKAKPDGQLRRFAQNPSAPLEFFKESDPHYHWNGILCRCCGDSFGWPYEK